MKIKSPWLSVLLLVCTSLVLSCAGGPQNSNSNTDVTKISAKKASPKAQKEFQEAYALYRAKKPGDALKAFAKFVQQYPNVDLTLDSYNTMAEIFFEQGDYFKAYRYWMAVVDSQNYTDHYRRALLGAAQSQSLMGHSDEALGLISRFKVMSPGQNMSNKEQNLNAQALELSSRLKQVKGKNLEALSELLLAKSFKRTTQEKTSLQQKAEALVMNQIGFEDLQIAAELPEYSDVEGALRYKLGVAYYEQRTWPMAKKQFDIVSSKFPASEYSMKSQQYKVFTDSQERTSSNSIGIVLPLSGKYSVQAYKVLRGIQMATRVFSRSGEGSNDDFKLAIADSGGTPEQAKMAVDKLVTEDHVVGIIGDIAGKTAQVVSERAQELGVPNITLSQKQGLTELGEFVFRNNLTPDMQMKALVQYAIKNRGYKRFAILYSNDPYGTEYATAFWDYVLSLGGTVTAAQTYAPEETDFRHAVQRLVGTFYLEEDRGAEMKLRMAQWKKDQTKKGLKEKPPKDLVPPVVDFDAIFIPDSPKAIGQVAPMLSYNEINNIPLLGTNLWNTPQLIERGAKFVENALFVDEFFSEDMGPAMKHFGAEFQNQFNTLPDVFEMQGYDAGVLMTSAIKSGSSTRSALRDALARSTNIKGALSPLSMNPRRDIEKSLIPLTVSKGQIVKADNESAP